MRRPEADCDVSAEERAAVLLLVAHHLDKYRAGAAVPSAVVTDAALERAHRATIYVTRIENTLIVDVEETGT